MCANCGLPSAPGHWTEAGLASPPERMRARFRRAQILRSVLSAYGLSAYDDAVMPGLIVATKTGHHELVADLAELWSAAERMSGRTIDPLDPRFIGEGDSS
jgi:hypothetical protein